MSDNLPERVQILGHAHSIYITVRENRIICCQIFCDLLLKSAFERIFNVMQLILAKIKWHIKWKYLIQKFHDICLSYYFKLHIREGDKICVMVFNATFSNISVISWLSLLLVEEAGVPGKTHRPIASHWQSLSHCIECISQSTGFELITWVVIGRCKFNYHTITTTMTPREGDEHWF